MQRNLAQNLLITLKGMAMGAADVVPGVSGGTIAFISGIYEELIESINNIKISTLKLLFSEGVGAFWKKINGTFLAFLFGGIGISIFTLSKIVITLLEKQPVLVWSFFFGLIVASVWLIGKTIKKWNVGVIIAMLIGIVVAGWISTMQTVGAMDSEWFVVFSGALAICAMILPGISGAFILILLGSYHTVFGAIKSLDFPIMGLFAIGCLIGLLSFARVLKFLFEKFRNITISVLTGFMIGSLLKVWPWKQNIGEAIVVHSDGREDFITKNVLPSDFAGESQLMFAVLCAIAGASLIIILEKLGKRSA